VKVLPRSRAGRIALLVAALGLAAGAIAYGSIPDSSGLIHGCYSANGAKVKGGTPLNIVDSNVATCSNGQTPIAWSSQGRLPGAFSYSFYTPGHFGVLLPQGEFTTVASVSLPAGSFFILGTTQLNISVSGGSPGPHNFVCGLFPSLPEPELQEVHTQTNDDLVNTVSTQGLVTLASPDTISLRCGSDDPGGIAGNYKLTALEVGTIDEQ